VRSDPTRLPWGPARPEHLPDRRLLVGEVWLVFALSLGASGVVALLQLIRSALSPGALSGRVAALNGSAAPGLPWLDLAFQLVDLAIAVVPVFLVAYLLARSGESGLGALGLDRRRPGADSGIGVALAAIIGGAGLGFYLVTHLLGVDLTVVPEALPKVWWRIPVLLLSALQNAVLEETLVAGYLLHRFRQLHWPDNRSLLLSAVIRGSYHLYQGLGGFAGNFIMGLVFGRIYQRYGRIAPLVVAHTLIDAAAFVGYALLAGHVSWIPVPHH
jgi:membrane protease YdiL (CAAX protease family)